jgi:hypothetical protein
VGRTPPSPDQRAGRGLWLANQLCDLVQIRSTEAGTVVRLHMRGGALLAPVGGKRCGSIGVWPGKINCSSTSVARRTG